METKLVLLKGSEQTESTTTNRIAEEIQKVAAATKIPAVSPTIVTIRFSEITGFTITKYAPVRRCGVICFKNETSGTVSIQFPVRDIFGADAVELEADGKMGSSIKLSVAEAARIGDHAYSAFCHAGMQFAIGGSMPIIIINPKDDR